MLTTLSFSLFLSLSLSAGCAVTAVRYEVGYRELQQMTVNLPTPNELLTAFSCKTLGIQLSPRKWPIAPPAHDVAFDV
jgi:hypothetical protein